MTFKHLATAIIGAGLLASSQAALAAPTVYFHDEFADVSFEQAGSPGKLTDTLYFQQVQAFGGFSNGSIDLDYATPPGTVSMTASTIGNTGFSLAAITRVFSAGEYPVLDAGFTARMDMQVLSLPDASFDGDAQEAAPGFGTRPGGLTNLIFDSSGLAIGIDVPQVYLGLRPGDVSGQKDLVAYLHAGNGSYKNGQTADFIGFTVTPNFGTITDKIIAVELDETNMDVLMFDAGYTNAQSIIGGPQAHGLAQDAFGDDPGTGFEYGTYRFKVTQFHSTGAPAATTVVDWMHTEVELPGAGIDGDLDGDGFVGITDLNIVLGNWNLTVPPADERADPSGDDFIGIEDLNVVLGNWNAGTPPAADAVPEPASLALLGLGGLAVLRRR